MTFLTDFIDAYNILSYFNHFFLRYYECTLNAQGVFDVARLACPAELYFSTSYQQCVPAYISDCLVANANTSTPTLPTPSPPPNSPTPGFPGARSRDTKRTNFNCTEEGTFKDASDTTCT